MLDATWIWVIVIFVELILIIGLISAICWLQMVHERRQADPNNAATVPARQQEDHELEERHAWRFMRRWCIEGVSLLFFERSRW
ncbi:hypothetical protein BT63DRAFT_453778 [Microthyrium microscopicum]|uniref:Uncharacterized protein n=1 Tax=Microthyrium microscopicum TaxID=703497 RepID=A0A6A6UIT6_9PEZI|nr:hypothetical protein BT63DRAFT_453778 [Microthyrium microscopicum]